MSTEGIVSVCWLSGVWTVIKEDDTVLETSASAKTAVQDAINYSDSNGFPLSLRSSRANPFVITNDTITFPPRLGNMVDARGTEWHFFNGAQHGFVYDTQAYGMHDFDGARTYYSGTGSAVVMKPNGSYNSGGVVTNWSRQHDYKLGSLFAAGGHPNALVLVDVTSQIGSNQFGSTSFVDNNISFHGEGWLIGDYGIWLLGTADPSQVIGENQINFSLIESCNIAEVAIGTSGLAANRQPGTCHWTGALSHSAAANGTVCIVCHGFEHKFDLSAMNGYAAGPTYMAYFTPPSNGNKLSCLQSFCPGVLPANLVVNSGTNNIIEIN